MKNLRRPGVVAASLFTTGLIVACVAALLLVRPAWFAFAHSFPMPVALGFLLAGLALMARATRAVGAWIIALPLAIVVIAIGGLYLIGQGARDGLGAIGGDWLVALPLRVFGVAEIAPLTSLNLTLVGAMLALLAAGRSRLTLDVAAALVASAVIAIALVSLFGDLSGSRFVYDGLRFGGTETPTSIAFLVLAGVAVAAVFFGDERMESRKWAPIPLWFGVFICALLLWQTLRTQEHQNAQQTVVRAADAIGARIIDRMESHAQILRRMASRWQTYAPNETEWRADAAAYIKDVPDLAAIYWADREFRVRWIEPAASSQAAANLPLVTDQARGEALAVALQRRDVAITEAIEFEGGELERGAFGLHFYVPVYDSATAKDAAGILVGVFRLQPWIDALKTDFPGFAVSLRQGEREIYNDSGAGASLTPALAVTKTVEFDGGGWSLRVTPTRKLAAATQTAIPESALLSGIGLASLLAFLAFLLQMAWRRSRQLSISNRALAYEVRQRATVERQLREAEQRARSISSAVRDYAIYTLSVEGLVTSWNEGAQLIHGYTAEEIVGRNFSVFFTEDQIERSLPQRSLQLAALHGRHEDEDLRVTGDGGQFCADEVITPMRDEHGELQGYSVIMRDITERRNIEHKIRESRDFYIKLLGDFPNPVRRLDAAGKGDYFNQAWLTFTGRALEQELGDGWLENVHAEDRERVVAACRMALAARQPFEVEYRLRRADGDYGILLDFGRPLYDQSGRLNGYIGAAYDVTARREAETALRASEARYEAMTSNVPGMVFQLEAGDGALVFTYVSRKVYQLFRIGPSAVKANPGGLLDLMPPQDRERFKSSLAEASERMGEWEWDGRVLPKSRELKEIKWVVVRASPTRLPNGTTLWDGVLLDDTARRRAQLEVEHSREQLRALSHHLQGVREEEKAGIAREIHDELGGILTALKMDIAWLTPRLSPPQAPLLERIRGMSQLVDSAVYAMRRISSELRPTLLDDLGLVAALQWQAGEFEKRTGVVCAIDCDPEDSEVPNDLAVAFFRVFQEALTNVTRHARAKQVTVTWRERPDCFVLQVADDGAGFSDGHRIKPTSHGIRGMTERARHLYGNVSVASAPGKGTTVTVSLPKPGRDSDSSTARSSLSA